MRSRRCCPYTCERQRLEASQRAKRRYLRRRSCRIPFSPRRRRSLAWTDCMSAPTAGRDRRRCHQSRLKAEDGETWEAWGTSRRCWWLRSPLRRRLCPKSDMHSPVEPPAEGSVPRKETTNKGYMGEVLTLRGSTRSEALTSTAEMGSEEIARQIRFPCH